MNLCIDGNWLFPIPQREEEEKFSHTNMRYLKVKVTQLCLTLCDPMDSSMEFSRQEYWSQLPFPPPGDLPNPGIKTWVSCISCIGRWILYHSATGEAPRMLEWVVIPFSRGSSQPKNRTQVSYIAGRFFTVWATREYQEYWSWVAISVSRLTF